MTLTSDKLHDYQVKALQFLAEQPEALLLADMGTGKTVITLTHLSKYKYRTLVIAPLRVCQLVWAQEAASWLHLKHLTFSHVLGSPIQRRKALTSEADVYLINPENIEWLIKEGFKLDEFDLVVLDELSLWRGRGKRWKALNKMRYNIKRIIGLTGTFTPNGLQGVWAQMQLISPGSLGRTYTGFLNTYFYPTDFNRWNWELKAEAEPRITQLIEEYVHRISASQLKMPELVMQRVQVELPEKVGKLCRTLIREGLVEIDDDVIVAESAAVASNKVTQIANGRVYDVDRRVIEVHTAKQKAVKEVVADMQGSPVLIAYNYQHDVTALFEMFPDAELLGSNTSSHEAERIINAWNAGEVPVLLGHPASMGHGLNIQAGGHHVIVYGLTWNLEYFQQLIARLARQGQQAATVFVHLLCAGPLDNTIADALINKADVQQAVLDYFERVQG